MKIGVSFQNTERAQHSRILTDNDTCNIDHCQGLGHKKNMLVSNLEFLPDRKITKHLGLVQGSSVRSKHVGRDIAASFKNFFGGELRGYTELLTDSREEATERMLEQARGIGANAVLNVRYSTSSIAAGAAEIFVYGTAVELAENLPGDV